MAEVTKTAKTALPKAIFAVDVSNHELLKLAYDAFLANARLASATTKQRGEVRGGGKKPHAQKGTGRARSGSSRNPLWRGGGIVFGPRGNENYTKKLSKTAKRVAIKQALTLAGEANKIVVAEFAATGKTVGAVAFVQKHAGEARRVLLVVDEKTPELIRSTNNLQNVLLIRTNYLNVYHVLNADKIILAPSTIGTLENWLAKEEA